MKLKDRISYWWNSRRIFSKGWNEYHNPYYYWWKARKYFKRPFAHFIHGEYNGYFGLPISTKSYKWINFYTRALGWKSKWHSPRHEWDPIVCLIVKSPFRTKIQFKDQVSYIRKQYWIGWQFNWVPKEDKHKWRSDTYLSSMATWEAILDILYFDKDPKTIADSHKWLSGTGDNQHEITINKNMK